MSQINREKLLLQLESVQPGLSARDEIEQSSCYVFQEGIVFTFNQEISCSHACECGITGAVKAAALLAILRKMPEEEVEISMEDGSILIKGANRRASIAREETVTLPIDTVDKPGKWYDLAEGFLDAIELVQHCASNDKDRFALTCVHIAPDFIEACDNAQLTRAQLPTGLKQSILVRRNSVKHIVGLGMTKISETETWVHFKNPSGLILSCRRFDAQDYPDFAAFLDFKGQQITLPKGLVDAADRAAIFAAENTVDSQDVLVSLRPGEIQVKGEGISGWYKERKKLDYDGPELHFMISPTLLMDIVKKHDKAQIIKGRLRVDGGKWSYVSCLYEPSEKQEAAPRA